MYWCLFLGGEWSHSKSHFDFWLCKQKNGLRFIAACPIKNSFHDVTLTCMPQCMSPNGIEEIDLLWNVSVYLVVKHVYTQRYHICFVYIFSCHSRTNGDTHSHTCARTVYISFNDIASLSNKTFATSICYFNIIVTRGHFTQRTHTHNRKECEQAMNEVVSQWHGVGEKTNVWVSLIHVSVTCL